MIVIDNNIGLEILNGCEDDIVIHGELFIVTLCVEDEFALLLTFLLWIYSNGSFNKMKIGN